MLLVCQSDRTGGYTGPNSPCAAGRGKYRRRRAGVSGVYPPAAARACTAALRLPLLRHDATLPVIRHNCACCGSGGSQVKPQVRGYVPSSLHRTVAQVAVSITAGQRHILLLLRGSSARERGKGQAERMLPGSRGSEPSVPVGPVRRNIRTRWDKSGQRFVEQLQDRTRRAENHCVSAGRTGASD